MLSTVLPLHQKCITIATLLYIVDGIKLYGTYNEQLCHASQSIGWFWRLMRLQMHCLLNDGWILCKLKCKCISIRTSSQFWWLNTISSNLLFDQDFSSYHFFIQAILIAMKWTFKHRDYLQMFEETSESMHFVSISIYLRVYSLHNK